MRRQLFVVLSVIGMTIGSAFAQLESPNLQAGCTLGSVIAAGTQCETSVALGLTKQIAAELTSMGIVFAQLSANCLQHCKNKNPVSTSCS
jgi:hypothetical protein